MLQGPLPRVEVLLPQGASTLSFLAAPTTATRSATGRGKLLAGLHRGWVLLPPGPLGVPSETSVVIDLILLRAQRGIVLLELPPNWTPDATQHLRRRLAQARVSATFPGHLPVLHAPLHRSALAGLPPVPAADFAAEPPRALAGGDALLAIGDLSGARRFHERAAEAGSPEGALAAARTHDPAVLATLGVLGTRADPEAAAAWYRQAAILSALEVHR